jgi:tetratricopeptide (TPR) repeat protein
MGLFGKDKITKLYDKAFDLADKNNHEECIKYYNKIIEINSNEFKAWRGKGLAFSALEKEDEAIICFDKALEINPNDDLTQKFKQASFDIKDNNLEIEFSESQLNASNLFQDGRYEEALVCFDELLVTKPKDSNLWWQKGDILISLDRYKEGLQCYDKSLQINPEDGSIWTIKGLTLNFLKREDEAIICFDKALEINPNDHEALKGKQSMTENKLRIIRDLGIEGQELYGLKKYEEAMQCFKKVLKMDAKLEIKLEDEQIDAFEGMIKLCLSKLNKSQNEKTPQPQISSSDDDPLKILKTRLAKGEITLKEFNEIKENLV